MTGRPLRLLVVAATPLGGCAGIQSVLEPAGTEALDVSILFWTVTAVSIAVTLLVVGTTAIALAGPEQWRGRIGRPWIVWGAGIILPTVVLTLLLGYGLFVLEAGATRTAGIGAPGITVVGKRWWWHVVYDGPDGRKVVSANEIRLPVGRTVRVRLESDNVIHSFWVPRLAGKLDMIPGRTNILSLHATEAGVSRGQCAEYCGGAHALMSFNLVAMPPDEFDAWLRKESAPAADPVSEPQKRGKQLFLENGCGACHAIRGTAADGAIGPDLTHLGGRTSLAAATLPNNAEAIARWITQNQHIKPENLMPDYGHLGEDDLAAIAVYLEALE